MTGEGEGWARLARNLRAEIDEERIEAYRGTVSLPFELGEYRRIAVKFVDDRGIESMKVIDGDGIMNRKLSVPREQIAAFCKKHGIRRQAIFGSALWNDFRPDSDVNVLVEFEPERIPTLFDLVDMEQELATLEGGKWICARQAI